MPTITRATAVASWHQRGSPAFLENHFCLWRVCLSSGPLAKHWLVISKQAIKQYYIFEALAHLLLQSLSKHVKNIKHIKRS